MRREQNDPASIILRRLQAEEAMKEWKRKSVRPRIAGSVRTLWSQRAFLVRLSGLGFVLGAVIAFLLPTRYTSTARLMPPDNQSGSSLALAASMAASRGTGGFGEIAGDLLGVKGISDVFVGILGSRTVQNQVIEQFDLRRVYGVGYLGDARVILASRVGISVDRKNQIISISVSDHSPRLAQAIATSYIDQLNRLVTELSTSSARRERIFLEGRLQEVNQELETAEKDFSQFASKKGAIDITEQGKAMVDAAATLQGQLMFARSELEGMRQIYADSNAHVRDLSARIAELQSQLEKFGGKDQASRAGAHSDSAALYPSIRELPLLGVTYADLSRRTKVEEEIYGILTQEYELAKVKEAREIPTVKLLDPPDLPERKNFPPRLFIAVSTMLLACTGGIVLLLVSKSWTEKDPHDPSKVVATEIWIDLKEKRFLNSVNGASHEPAAEAADSPRRKRGIFSFLGLNRTAYSASDFHPSSRYIPEEEERAKEA